MSVSYAFLRRKCSTMQHGNSKFFSQNGFPPRCQMTSPLRARTTVRSMRFLHSGAMENVTYTRTVQNCIPSSGVHLSSPIRLHRVMGLRAFIYLLVTSRNNPLMRRPRRRLISRKGIRYYFSCGCLSSFNRKKYSGVFVLVPKIQRPKIFEMEKNDQLITTTTTKNKK